MFFKRKKPRDIQKQEQQFVETYDEEFDTEYEELHDDYDKVYYQEDGYYPEDRLSENEFLNEYENNNMREYDNEQHVYLEEQPIRSKRAKYSAKIDKFLNNGIIIVGVLLLAVLLIAFLV